MTEAAGYVLEPLRQGADFTLYRGRKHGNSSPVLAVAVTAEQPSPHGLRRLEHEYSLAAELDPAWTARPLALTRREGRTILILQDPGGEPLDRVLERAHGQPLDLTRFLGIAIGLATALGQVHRRGLIHKDSKPANVLVKDIGNIWFIGFGIASQVPHEHQAPAPPEIIAGTLAYMAPEQTGRMNRSIDARSDLYSLGVTLYQMLTGTLPFSADAPSSGSTATLHVSLRQSLIASRSPKLYGREREVNALPAETQITLLRVLQQFERVGGAGSMRTNVRVIAATNPRFGSRHRCGLAE
jgi:serine/threonine protein kinase